MFSENRDWEGIEFFKRNRINNFEESMNSRVGSQSLRGHSLAVVGVGAAAWHRQWWMVPAGAGEVKLKQSQVQLHWTWGAPISAAQLHIVMKNGKPNIPERPASEQHRYGWKILLISNFASTIEFCGNQFTLVHYHENLIKFPFFWTNIVDVFEGRMLDSIYDLCEAGNYKEAMFLFHSTAKSFEYKSPQFIA